MWYVCAFVCVCMCSVSFACVAVCVWCVCMCACVFQLVTCRMHLQHPLNSYTSIYGIWYKASVDCNGCDECMHQKVHNEMNLGRRLHNPHGMKSFV